MQKELSKKNKIENKNHCRIFTMENLLCLLIIICPILDVSSFIFRNFFNTNFSISTFVRPIIPIIAITYIFFKDKIKPQIIIAGIAYLGYAICHVYIFYKIKTGCAYGNELREIQYLVNYTFMVMNLFIYIYFFVVKNREKEITKQTVGKSLKKVKKAVLIALTIYIVLMYLALITKTSSFTYGETQVGYKGWFESGNSIGTIMLLSLFIVLPMLNKENKLAIRIWGLMITVLVGAYLCTLLGTRTGLFGFIIVVMAYIAFTVLYNLLNKNKLNKKILTIGVIILVLVGIAVTIFGSKTIERRRELKNKENEIYDTMTNQTAHVTGDTVELVKKIKAGQMDENYMSESMQQAYLNLYNIANEKQISNTNMRTLQLIYHSNLIKEQNSIPMLLFGNGYMSHYYEMIFEMEVPAFLFNFGIIGFFLYFTPFLMIAVYGIYVILKKIKVAKGEFAMALSGLWFAIIISFLSGYTFFNSSTMMIIIALSVIVINQIKDIDDNEVKIYNPEKGNDTL